ncbi:integrase/recombinase [Streptococcus satellite phage Javan292]|uniref:tyrosine-type recombinase/integrase n=1 Tax=Streptococcus marmotae TaxID=1825069 RepID=UPI00082BF1FE|nr:site-specific integrase [Streptococcus marmotae]QBX08737.1 integrase/recombinase [Streptococcus satellite phage Javan292]
MNIKEVKKKNGSIVYRASIYLGIDSLTGKKVRTTVTAPTKKGVQKKTKLAIHNFLTNGATVAETVSIETYDELVSLWWDSYKYTVKENTRQDMKGYLKKHIRPAFGKYKLKKITTPIIQRQVNQWANAANKGEAGAFADYHFLHAVNRRILQYGVAMQALPSNPARDVLVPRKAPRDKEPIKYLDDENLKKFLVYLDSLPNTYQNNFDTVLYKLLLATGLRISEALALEWSDIDLQQATLEVNKTLTRSRSVNSPKSKTSNRILDLDKKTVLMLRLYKNRQQEKAREIGATPTVVFSKLTSKYMPQNTALLRLKQHIKSAGVTDIAFHGFRHTHASLLLNAGLPYKELQHRLGHASISMTMDIYSHLSKENMKKAASVFETALDSLTG